MFINESRYVDYVSRAVVSILAHDQLCDERYKFHFLWAQYLFQFVGRLIVLRTKVLQQASIVVNAIVQKL